MHALRKSVTKFYLYLKSFKNLVPICNFLSCENAKISLTLMEHIALDISIKTLIIVFKPKDNAANSNIEIDFVYELFVTIDFFGKKN